MNTNPSFTDEADPYTATNEWSLSLTYVSTTDEVNVVSMRDTNPDQVYANATDADTISWGTEFSIDFSSLEDNTKSLTATYSVADGDDIGMVVRLSTTDYEFSTVPETSIVLLFLTPFLPNLFTKLKESKKR